MSREERVLDQLQDAADLLQEAIALAKSGTFWAWQVSDRWHEARRLMEAAAKESGIIARGYWGMRLEHDENGEPARLWVGSGVQNRGSL